ncbi:MAG TPA: hypothetical protein VIO38_01000 [Rariglobus sp.]
MARARDAGSSLLLTSRTTEFAEIISWYEDLLDRAAPPAGLEWEPVKIGPTWQYAETGWLLPRFTLGWDVLAWCGVWLRGKGGKPWAFTAEQARFVLWFYALDETGTFIYHSAVLQRLKGWGKDPVAACLAVASMFADVIFDHWDDGRPVGREDTEAWTQILAVSQDQTKNTMKLMPALISPEARKHYGIQIGRLNVWGLGDTRQAEAVTSSPMALEGNRGKLIIRNETQNWNGSNGGHDMAGTLEGNAAKAEVGSPARVLDICNAYRPGEDSVAQRVREAWETTQGDDATALDYGLLYDSLEAPPGAPLTADAAPAVVAAVRGDAVWLDAAGRIRKSILNPSNSPSESRRKWYNQITAAEDAWMTPQLWDPIAATDVEVEPGDEVVLFLDASKSDDATGLVGCRVTDGHLFTVGMWQKPPGERGKGWLAPREKVDAAVVTAFEKYNVVAFFMDPSHTLDDETVERYWDGMADEWHRRYRSKLRLFAKPGKDGHSVMFDMALYENQKRFVEHLGILTEEIEQRVVTHDGDPRLRKHVLAAKRWPTKAGMSIAKDHRESKNKIDLAVCAVGAGMVRRAYLNSRVKKGGRVW